MKFVDLLRRFSRQGMVNEKLGQASVGADSLNIKHIGVANFASVV